MPQYSIHLEVLSVLDGLGPKLLSDSVSDERSLNPTSLIERLGTSVVALARDHWAVERGETNLE